MLGMQKFNCFIKTAVELNLTLGSSNKIKQMSVVDILSPYLYSRSRCSPYDVTDHKSDQMSTPIELNDIPSDPITLPDTVESFDQELPDPISVSQELDNNYDEAYDDISFVNHSLSQQPLLNMSTFTPTNV